jgi:heme iron utilization protein
VGQVSVKKNIYFLAECKVVEEGTEQIYTLFDKRYGESLSFLRSMRDFKIIEFTPDEKSLVLGFGAAYKMGVDGELQSKSISHK